MGSWNWLEDCLSLSFRRFGRLLSPQGCGGNAMGLERHVAFNLQWLCAAHDASQLFRLGLQRFGEVDRLTRTKSATTRTAAQVRINRLARHNKAPTRRRVRRSDAVLWRRKTPWNRFNLAGAEL